MQELYKSFQSQSDVLQEHHTRRTAVAKALENVLGCKTHIRDKPQDMPIMDNLRAKKTEVTIETWEGIYYTVDSIIHEGQATCKRRQRASDGLLGFLKLPMLAPINQAVSPKLKLEKIEQTFTAVKEQDQGVTQITLQEITSSIEILSSTMVKIQVYLGEWKKVQKREITSQILRAEVHIEQAKYQDIDFLMDLDAKWCSAVGQTKTV